MARVLPHEFRLTPIEELKPHPKNARKHADEEIARSLDANGFYKPLVASRASGYVLCGNGTLDRARALGYTEIPIYWIDGLTPTQEAKILAADNRTADLSPGYDEVELAELLNSIKTSGDGFDGTGFTQQDFDSLVDSASEHIRREARGKVKSLKGNSAAEAPERAVIVSQELAGPAGKRWAVVVECQNELHQTELIERLKTEGLTCRAM